MTKLMFAFAALTTLAATAPVSAQMAAGALPKCSATVVDSCDQSMTTEKNAMSADQAMKTGGVGDRAGKGMAAKPMTMRHKMKPSSHHTMKSMTMTKTNDTTSPAPQ